MSHTPASESLQGGPVHTKATTHEKTTTTKEISSHNDSTKRVNLSQRTKLKLSPHDLRTRRRDHMPVESVEDTPVLHRITRDVVKVQVATPAFQKEPISYSVNTPLSSSILATHDALSEREDKHGRKEHSHISSDSNKSTGSNHDSAANVGKANKSSEEKRRNHSKNKKKIHVHSSSNSNSNNKNYEKMESNDSYSSSTSSANTDNENRNIEKDDNENKNNKKVNHSDYNNNVYKPNETDNVDNTPERQSEVGNKSIVLLAPRELDTNDDSYCESKLDKRIDNAHDTQNEDSHGSNSSESNSDESEESIICEYAKLKEQEEDSKQIIDDLGHTVNPIFVTAHITQTHSQSEASTLESEQESEKIIFAQHTVSIEHSTHTIVINEKKDNDWENVKTMDSDPHNGTSVADNKHKSRNSGNNNNNYSNSGGNQSKNTHEHHNNNYNNKNNASPFTRANKNKFPGAKAVEEDVTSFKVKVFVGLGVVLGVGATIMLLRSIHKLDSAAARASETARGMFRSIKTYYVPYTHSTSLSARKVALTPADEQRETVARIRERLISSKLKAVKYERKSFQK